MKRQEATGLLPGRGSILKIERGSTRLYSVENLLYDKLQ